MEKTHLEEMQTNSYKRGQLTDKFKVQFWTLT